MSNATLYSEERTTLRSPNAISTENVHLNAGHFVVNTDKLNNKQGSWIQRGTETFSLNLKNGLDNTQGKMASEGAFSIQSPLIQNHQGVLWSNERLQMKADSGQIDSRSGYLFGKNNVDIHSATLNNQQGEILSKQVSLSSQQMNNEDGKIIAGNKADLSIKQLNNQRQGIIYSKGELVLNAQNLLNQEGIISSVSKGVLNAEQLDNRQGIIQGAQDFTIQTNALNNEQGDISAKNTVISSSKIDNDQGMITAQHSLTLSGSHLDNRGGVIQAKQAEVNLSALNNSANGTNGSLLSAANRLILNVANINNQQTKATQATPNQGIQAGELVLNAEHLDNQSGGIYIGKSATLAVNQSLDNQQGEMLSVGRIDVVNPNFTLVVDNTLGQIESVLGTTLQAKTLVNEGVMNTKGDLGIALNDSFTLNQAFGVGNNLTFSTKGDFINDTNLVVGNQAFIQGENIQNNAKAEISSVHTDIQAKKVDNLGLIDGDTTVIKANEVDNLGIARIYGTHLAIQADALNNLENADGEAATIAARERLDLGVGQLVNRNHSLIMSLGSLHIGGQLDENNQATGYANSIDNSSATIEALGSGWIRTHHLLNHDLNLKLGENHTYEDIVEYAVKDSSKRYVAKNKNGGEGYFDLKNNSKSDSNSYFVLKDGTRIASRYWKRWTYNRHTVTTTIENRDPAQLLIGGSLQLQGNDLENNGSTLAVGHQLLLDDTVITSNENNRNLKGKNSILKNIDIDGTINQTDTGIWDSFGKEHKRYGVRGKRRWSVYGTGKDSFQDEHPVEHFKFNKVLNTIGLPVNGTGAQVGNKTDFQGISLAQKTPLATDLNVKPVDMENITSGVVKNQDNLGIKTHLPDITLPQASLYKINPESGKFLVETDPRFTDRNKWLSSDYMFKALRSDPQNLLKRLGDGFYEQRLVNEQINQLTGRRFLEGYLSDYEQYKALMDNGAQYAKRFNLIPGVALTAAQMKELTSDMVWMVKREVTLKDGTKTEVLAPQVYIVGRNTDIDSQGAVISANDVIVNTQGDLKNSGVIAGRNLSHLSANNIENLGGTLQGRDLYLFAKNRLDNLGGALNAEENLVGSAKNINIASTLSETADNGRFKHKNIDRVASIHAGDNSHRSNVALYATENITLKGANVNVKGDVDFQAGEKLNFGTVETQNKQHYIKDSNNYYKLDQQNEVGSQLNIEGDSRFVGKSAVEMRGVSLHSEGKVDVASEGNIDILESRQQERLSEATKHVQRGAFQTKTEIRRHNHNYDLAEGSTLDADKINLHSSKGNVTVQGSNVVAENGLTVQAKNIDIKEAENRVYSDDFYSKKKSGMLDGGIGITFGSQKQTTEADQTKYYASGSQVGSLNGNTTLIAENNYTQTASAVSAVTGDVNILAKQATIQAADDKYETHSKQTFEQKGLTLAITSPILSALQVVQGAVQSAEKTGKSKSDRVNAMAAANAGMDAYRAGQAVGQARKAVSDFMNGTENIDSVVGVQITYGQQKNVSKTHTEGSTAAKSQVNAGGKVNIVATGAGKDSNINIKGADVSGKQGTTLMADNDINITAAEQHHKERSTNKSSGFNAGVAIKVSNGVAAGVTVGGNYGKGYGNGDETTYVASHVGDANSQTTVMAGGDANLIGSQLKGKRVELEAQNLNIESLQDKSTYKGKQMNVAGSVTVGYGFAASGSYSQSKINADHASVNEQAGIYAGDDGYNINVNKHTDLKGAIITSTQQAEDNGKNQFTTGSLTHSDIENHSNYSGSSFGVSGSVAANFETPLGKDAARQSSKQATDKDGNALYTDKNGNTTVSATDANGKSNKAKAAEGWSSVQATGSMGYGSDSDSQNSVTKSGINTQNITIKDEAEQLKRTGKTVEETIAAIKTDITTDNAEAQSGKLTNNFDKDKVQKELDLQREVTESFGQTVTQTGAMIAEKMSEESNKKKYEAAVELENAKKAREENDSETNRAWEKQAQANFDTANREAKEWETGGSQRRILDSALNVVSTFLAGRPATEVVASGLSPTINHQIKEMTTDKDGNVNTPVNLMAHAIWGGIEAYAGNRSVAAGAAGAAAGEATASAISQLLYDKSPDKLTQEEKLTVSTLSQAAASIAGGTLANNADGAIIAAKTAKDAVENNSFALDGVMNNPQVDWLANAKAQEKISAAERKAMEDFEKAHPELIENLKTTGDVASFIADFVPVVGDVKSFAEAEDGIDYALAFVGMVPGSEVVTKPLKAAKASIQKARAAEKLGNAAEVVKHQQEAARYIDNSVNGFYDSKEFRKAFEDTYGKNNVVSTTVPPNSAKNTKYAGKRHPVTGVPFDNKGYAIFDDIAKYDTKLDVDYYRSLGYMEQMKAATKEMYKNLGDSEVVKRFNQAQVKAIRSGSSKIPGYTWHHHQDTGRMQLVPEWEHSKTGHVGGDYIQQGK